MTDLSDFQMGELTTKGIETALACWTGPQGNAYISRNAPMLKARTDMWDRILDPMYPVPLSILEVGANVGQNIHALRCLLPDETEFAAVEPNANALHELAIAGIPAINATADDLPFLDDQFDMSFTSGVLIHVPPDQLLRSCSEILRVARHYVVSIEYFSDKPEEIAYRGQSGLLWKRDFGQYWIDNFGLKPVACGFEWRGLTGLDNLTWWVMSK